MASFTIQELKSMITVNMGDYKVAKGTQKLATWDLGSCVGVAVRDPKTEIGGLLHIMLPGRLPNEDEEGSGFNPAKYADTGIDEMIKQLMLQGAEKERLVAKIAGGAHIIRSIGISESTDLSSRNVQAVRSKLISLNIPLLASDVGGYAPRTVIFEPSSGKLKVITLREDDKII